MNYQEPLFRPPAEAGSLIFQVAYGCPHNRCRFCGMYKRVRYRLRPEEEVLAEIADAGRRHPGTARVFLADGDCMALPFDRLKRYLEALNRAFPSLARVGSYANGSSIQNRTGEELAARKARWVCPEPKIKTGYLARYARLVSSADKGAILE